MILLYGAFGRHNFGDMLFPHILETLIPDREFVPVDLVEKDMTQYGGHNVQSVYNYIWSGENVDVIHVGGEVGQCKHRDAVRMHGLPPIDPQLPQLTYILNKDDFMNPGTFIGNALGGLLPYQKENFDYVCARDKVEGIDLVPDSATVVRDLFEDRIKQATVEIKKPYIAIQCNEIEISSNRSKIAELSQGKNVVFFCAGRAKYHDNPDLYPPDKSLPNTNIWEICKIISEAEMVATSSLHTHIIARQYDVPAVALTKRSKVINYLDTWGDHSNKELNDMYYESLNRWVDLI